MFENVVACLLFGGIIGLVYSMIYAILVHSNGDDVVISCTVFGLIVGGIFGVYLTQIETKLFEITKLQTDLINTKMESERIKEQAVAAGLGYWREETAVIKRDFIIASQTASFTAELNKNK